MSVVASPSEMRLAVLARLDQGAGLLRASAGHAAVLVACAAGIVMGLAYTLSPVTMWFGLWMVGIFVWAGRALSGRERMWVVGLLSVAIAFRLVALIALFFFVPPSAGTAFPALIPDERYIALRSIWLRNIALSIPMAPADYIESAKPYGESGLHYVFAYLQLQLGAAPYGVRLVNVALYVTATVMLYRIARPAFGRLAALGGLSIALFLPSMFVWSISALKEPAYGLLTAISLSAVATVLRADSMCKRALAIITCAIAVLAVGTMRVGAQFMVGGGILAALLFVIWMRRPVLLLISVVLCLMFGFYSPYSSRVKRLTTDLMRTSVAIHMGHVRTPGWSYKLLDPHVYARRDLSLLEIASELPAADIARYGVSAAASFVLVPVPWRAASPPAVAYLFEQVVWYVLVGLAMFGCIAGIRRDAPLTLMFVGIMLTSAATVAFTSGNVGTLIRHRSMVLTLLPWVSSLGACMLFEQVARYCDCELRPKPVGV